MIRRSYLVCGLHGVLLVSLILISLFSYPFHLVYPGFYDWIFLPCYIGMIACTIKGWSKGCLLTAWENEFRVQECKVPYDETFILHYMTVMRMRVPGKFITIVLLSLMILPILVVFLG